MLDYAALPGQRQALIRQKLQENGRVISSELATYLKVSEHTIRRDLHELSKDGICKKVYGGAIIITPDEGNFDARKEKNTTGKSKIAQKCIQLIKPNSCIFIDSGTTHLAMAELLSEEFGLTVVTNSPEIAVALLKKPLCEVIILGGQVQKSSGGSIGTTALVQLQGFLFDQVFIGACAMAPESGLMGFDYADCEFKKRVIQQSNETIVALTADKIPAVARYNIATCNEIDVIVAEESISKEYDVAFGEYNIRLYTA